MEERIRLVPKPQKAAQMGRSRRERISGAWASQRDEVMLEVIRAKFSQHDELQAQLLGTGDNRLVYHTETDMYWGDGIDGRGKNRLGETLMQVRTELRAAQTK